METHIAIINNKPIRLQEYGIGVFKSLLTKSALKKALKKELITIDGKIATSATFIKGGEILIYKLEEKGNPIKLFNLKLRVLFEDNYLAVIHKPAGILVSGNHFKTIRNVLMQNLQWSTVADAVPPQPVHRLDYSTTGLLLIGKTASSIQQLNKLFEEKRVQKTYTAITIGKMKTAGVIKSRIDGKEALTQYTVITTVNSERFGNLNLVKLNPKTGRRHQLRKHLFSMGNPILGDATYFLPELFLKGKGMYLHAQSLKFSHPITKLDVTYNSVLPLKFKKIFLDYD